MEFNWVNKYEKFLKDVNGNEVGKHIPAMTNDEKVKALLLKTLLVDNANALSSENDNVSDVKKLSEDEKWKLMRKKERVKSIKRYKGCHWSWYGYSDGHVLDGYIRSDDTLVVKERFVGNKSFQFNHKDYKTGVGDNSVNEMDRSGDDDENIRAENIKKNKHNLKINHSVGDSLQKQMKCPDIFTTCVDIRPFDFTDYSWDGGSDDDVETEYLDEINLTMLREDISIEDHVLKSCELINQQVGKSESQTFNMGDTWGSYDNISVDHVINDEGSNNGHNKLTRNRVIITDNLSKLSDERILSEEATRVKPAQALYQNQSSFATTVDNSYDGDCSEEYAVNSKESKIENVGLPGNQAFLANCVSDSYVDIPLEYATVFSKRSKKENEENNSVSSGQVVNSNNDDVNLVQNQTQITVKNNNPSESVSESSGYKQVNGEHKLGHNGVNAETHSHTTNISRNLTSDFDDVNHVKATVYTQNNFHIIHHKSEDVGVAYSLADYVIVDMEDGDTC